jgi:hypothetical protein
VTRKTSTPVPPRRSPTSFSSRNISSVGGQGGGKTKNSTNREQGLISKAMDRMAESIESGGGGGETVGVIYDFYAVDADAAADKGNFNAAADILAADADADGSDDGEVRGDK